MIQELIQNSVSSQIKIDLNKREVFVKKILDTHLNWWDKIKCQFYNGYNPVRKKVELVYTEKRFGVKLYDIIHWMDE